ncbi:MAG: PEP-CTERM sorting domain-containing protein [Phycisphaerales bacterium]|nr:MAG: PEP-CTERM sorting domain-containing protein [Phycisphaerales bacterium]
MRSARIIALGIVCAAMTSPADATNVRVLLTGAAGTGQFADTQANLLATNRFAVVDIHDASTAGTTPTLALLQQYDAVMVWSNQTYASDFDLGNVLADYVDAGGGVVTAVFTTSTTTVGRSLLGRWDSEQYWIIEPRSGNTSSSASLGTILEPTHPTAENVFSLSASSAFRPNTFNLGPGGRMIATWNDGRPLITVSDTRPGRVDLGMYPPSSNFSASWWQVGTDGAVIMANALEYAAGGGAPICRPDLNNDGVVDADDFFLFLQLFADGDLRADFNNDGVIDADDFFVFLNLFAQGC